MLRKCKSVFGAGRMLIFTSFFCYIMLNRKPTLFILLAGLSLLGLLLVQGYWFGKAFSLEERAFDEKVHLSLRAFAHGVLKQGGDTTTRIRPVEQPAANQYRVALSAPVTYATIHALLQQELASQGVLAPYELALYLPRSPALVVGGRVNPAADPKADPGCIKRETTPAEYEVAITFPGKQSHLAESLHIWYFSFLALLLVGVVFLYGFSLLRQQQQLAVAKRDFLNNMTHELKTPLANIALASEVLQNPAVTLSRPKALHYASLVYKETKRLEAQVSRVLEMARLEKGELLLQLNTVDVHGLIREIAAVVALPVEKRGGSLRMELHALQSIVQADAHHLKNVLYNLLENAEKYSLEIPAITIATRNVGDQLVISVKDQGKGMGLERELIFEPFFRASNGNRHDTKGFGLGLSYVKKVVEAHQGRIQVNSELQQGSQFDVFLRCA